MVYVHSDPTVRAGVLALVMRERHKAMSSDAWVAALQSYGYGVRKRAEGAFVTTLPHGVEICRLPDEARL
ncbi:hypothetical protein D6850_12785 [Roseovarius spongiae]|uniref:Uncharacterized protein n=1 Tax=Roseovarius spongiae TaxID=2320272 RepID=A0A3A8AWL3_9RHOB|nr:hypothetical protein [Roseovarius spongiae]RKF14044.1 hypothetical protein D6850_12785 [Roseovarius spongiae]